MRLKRPRILLVDDSKFIRIILRKLLTQQGYEIVGEAYEGVSAIQKYRELKPDLVLMDIVLPDPTMNGIETIKWIIKIDPQALIIIVSAVEHQGLINEALSAGAKNYCIKPFEANNLIHIIKDVLKKKNK
jgi:two-component system chemotaxis response regulator CheY